MKALNFRLEKFSSIFGKIQCRRQLDPRPEYSFTSSVAWSDALNGAHMLIYESTISWPCLLHQVIVGNKSRLKRFIRVSCLCKISVYLRFSTILRRREFYDNTNSRISNERNFDRVLRKIAPNLKSRGGFSSKAWISICRFKKDKYDGKISFMNDLIEVGVDDMSEWCIVKKFIHF